MEKKLYLAKQCPEPIFDLSACSLKQIPNGIFAVIKVLRKESLYLQDNKLISLKEGGNIGDLSLLSILDLSSNKISKLPSDIKYLVNLQVLRIDNNELTTLPDEIGCLTNLLILSVSANKLSALPSTIGKLLGLQQLDVRRNIKLKSLPSTIYRLKSLEQLLLDDENEWIAPPTIIVRQRSVHSILSYFAANSAQESIEMVDDINSESIDQSKIGYRGSKTNTSSTCNTDTLRKLHEYDQLFQDNLRRVEKEKEEKLLYKLNVEKNIIDEKEKQAILCQQNRRNTKFLDVLTAEQRKLDEQTSKYHQMKIEERDKMLKQLKLVENTADSIIAQLIKKNQMQKRDHLTAILASLKSDKCVQQHLHRQTVLESMEQLLAEECKLAKKLEQNNNDKQNIVLHSNELELRMRDKISNFLLERENDRNSLIEDVKRDSELQCAAVLMLIERSDINNIELQNQIALIENQLSNITAMELQNRNVNTDKHVNELAERRATLTSLLEDIFARQQCYRRKLIEELAQLEKRHSSKDRKDYWLFQYQKLLETGGDAISSATVNLNPSLIYNLALHGMSHYTPVLSKLDTSSVDSVSAIDDQLLRSIGIVSSDDRSTILNALKVFISDSNNVLVSVTTPSAPPCESIDDGVLPSAPSQEDVFKEEKLNLIENECVICMTRPSNIVFICCGHICCCYDCSVKLVICPLCRCNIERKIKIFTA